MSNEYLGVDFSFDEDGDFVVSSNGDFELAEGHDCLIQDVMDRLRSVPGELWGHKKFGNDTATMLGEPDTELNRVRAVRGIRVALQQEERIDPETINVELIDYSTEAKLFKIEFRARGEQEYREYEITI